MESCYIDNNEILIITMILITIIQGKIIKWSLLIDRKSFYEVRNIEVKDLQLVKATKQCTI